MKQGETITISGEFTGLSNTLGNYTLRAMVYCQNAKSGYKKLGFTNGTADNIFTGLISVSGDTYSFTISSAQSANLQGECQVELSLTDGSSVVITENYANFSVQNSVLGTSLNGNE